MTSEAERKEFSDRFRNALAGAGFGASPALITREFNIRTPDKAISVFAVRKWLMGEAIPTQDKVRILADWLAVSPQWLRFGGTQDQGISRTSTKGRVQGQASISSILGDYQRLSEANQFIVREMIVVLLKAERKRPARA